MQYKNILNSQSAEFNKYYKQINKMYPGLSIKEKQEASARFMVFMRGVTEERHNNVMKNALSDVWAYQEEMVSFATLIDVQVGIDRYYIKDDSLFDFFKNTPIKDKEVQSILDDLKSQDMRTNLWGVLGKDFSFTLFLSTISEKHVITVFTDEMNYTFVLEDLNTKEQQSEMWVYNMSMNFLFYLMAFPECVVDGVPAGEKKNSGAKTISISDKIVSHTSVEHGFVRPHFRSGYFRHFNSDFYVNCKGQVRFIASTMVKGKAKTVISRE